MADDMLIQTTVLYLSVYITYQTVSHCWLRSGYYYWDRSEKEQLEESSGSCARDTGTWLPAVSTNPYACRRR